jgi:nitrogen fixation protein NifU and related proteins
MASPVDRAAAAPSDMGVAALYQEIILSHYRSPKRKGVIAGAPTGIEHHNPLCGDVLAIQLVQTGGVVSDAAFTARACSITQATASLLLDRLIGRTPADAAALVARVDALVEGTEAATKDASGSLGDLMALSSVARFPARKPCVRLVTAAVREALDRG